MGVYWHTLKTNKNINYKVVIDKDREGRDICFVIIDDMLLNIFAIAQYSEKITIPNGVKVIKSSAVMDMADGFDPQGLECGELVIPASVERIEGNAFAFMSVDSISLDPENGSYILKDGSLYTRDEKTLVLASFRDEKWDERFCVANGTEELADGALNAIYIKRLLLPDSVVKFGDLAECENFCKDAGGVIYASADSPAAKYCEEYDIPFEEWDGSVDGFISEEEDVDENDKETEDEGGETTEMNSEAVPFGKAEIGSTILFGSYPQTAENDKIPIEWQVLDKQWDKLLLISKKGLACQPYNDEYADVTWENCTLRKWLNEEFYNNAFNSAERGIVCKTIVKAEKNPNCNTNPGKDTKDKVFLLSISECDKYYKSRKERVCFATKVAKKNGVWTEEESGACWWWIRSPGGNSKSAASVNHDGGVFLYGSSVNNDRRAVRPALWVKIPT